MNGLFLKTHDAYGKSATIKIDSFNLMTESTNSKRLGIKGINQWVKVEDWACLKMEGTAFRFLRCLHCGHNDFNNDSWDLNLYDCNGCGESIGIVACDQEKKVKD